MRKHGSLPILKQKDKSNLEEHVIVSHLFNTNNSRNIKVEIRVTPKVIKNDFELEKGLKYNLRDLINCDQLKLKSEMKSQSSFKHFHKPIITKTKAIGSCKNLEQIYRKNREKVSILKKERNRNDKKAPLILLQSKSPFLNRLPTLRDFKTRYHSSKSLVKHRGLSTNYVTSPNLKESIESLNKAYFCQLEENKIQYEIKVQKQIEEEKNRHRLFCLTDTDYFKKEKTRPKSNDLKNREYHAETFYSSYYIKSVKDSLKRIQKTNTVKIKLTPTQNNSEKKLFRKKSSKIEIQPTKIGIVRCIKNCVRVMKRLKLNYEDVLKFDIFSKKPFDKPKSKIFMAYVKENEHLEAKHLLEYNKFLVHIFDEVES